MSKVAQTPDNYNSWMEAQAAQSFIDDQRRYAPAPKYYAAGEVKLGLKSIADAQYAKDEEHGLVWLAMNRGW
jgi:hypothetical protein